jgi:hypothetical protein
MPLSLAVVEVLAITAGVVDLVVEFLIKHLLLFQELWLSP